MDYTHRAKQRRANIEGVKIGYCIEKAFNRIVLRKRHFKESNIGQPTVLAHSESRKEMKIGNTSCFVLGTF